MKHQHLFILVILLSPLFSFGQGNQSDIHQEIDQQLWKNFVITYNNYDAEGFNALHTDDVIRSGPRSLSVGEEYKNRNREGYKRGKESGTKRTISFTMESRQTRADLSYEVGYYKVTIISKDGNTNNYYGRFHCVLRKIDGQWKIAQDWDTDAVLGKKISEEDYQSGKPLKF